LPNGVPNNVFAAAVLAINRTSLLVTTFAGLALNDGFADGLGKNARFYNPGGIAIDENDNLYVGDCVNGAIRKIDAAGNVTTLARSLGQIYGLVWDGKGNLYAAGYTTHKIYKIDSSGAVTTIAGSTAGHTDGDGSLAQFNYPFGLAIDKDGNLYVSDESTHPKDHLPLVGGRFVLSMDEIREVSV